MGLLRLRIALLAAATLLIGCDHATKTIAKHELERRSPQTLLPRVFDLEYTENRDTGFSLLHAVPERIRTPALTAVQMLAGAAFLALSLRLGARRNLRIAFLLLSAGALGNGLDRLFRGYVVDFFYLHHWPVFNVADVYITCGAILLVLAQRRRRTPAPSAG